MSLTDDERADLWNEIDGDSARGMDNDQTLWGEGGYEEESGLLSNSHSNRSRAMKRNEEYYDDKWRNVPGGYVPLNTEF